VLAMRHLIASCKDVLGQDPHHVELDHGMRVGAKGVHDLTNSHNAPLWECRHKEGGKWGLCRYLLESTGAGSVKEAPAQFGPKPKTEEGLPSRVD
jgi:hypothetical protein